ncbi:MAG: hypothetical protein K1X92_14445 [Bacteroidia bacterium]|nr:hypothetical protein [Bacteroidia bacterium]
MNYKLLSVLLLSLFIQSIRAQNGFHLSSLPQLIHSQWYQPAYLSNISDSTDFQIGVDADGYLGTNAFRLGPLLSGGNYLTTENKDKMLGQMGKKNRVQFGSDYMIAANIRSGSVFHGVYGGYHTGTTIGINNKDLAGLIFKGNAHYEGQTITDKNDFYRASSWAELGWGISGKFQKITWGARIKGVAGFRNQFFDLNSISTLTTTDGEEISLDADYSFFRTAKGAGLTGGGVGIDLGATMPVSDKIMLSASVLNAGVILNKGTKTEGNFSVNYTGFDLLDLIDQDSTIIGETIDSVRQLVFPDTVSTTRVSSLPTVIHFNAIYSLNESSKVTAGVRYGFTQNAYLYHLPVINLGYQYKLKKIMTFGLNACAGGTDTYGVGAFALAEFKSRTQIFNVYLQSENILGMTGGIGKGFNAQAGISAAF